MLRIIFLIVFLTWSQTSLADTFPSAAAAKVFTDKVLAKVGAGDVEAGVSMIKPYTIIPAAEFEAMAGQIALQLPAVAQRFGKPVGSEFIKESKVGDSFVRLLYLSKYEKHAMRWNFYLYKTPQGWVINTFNFDDKIHEMF
jgi:hypothetical protein